MSVSVSTATASGPCDVTDFRFRGLRKVTFIAFCIST